MFEGASHETRFLDIDSGLDWAALRSGAKTQIRSTEPLIDPEEEMPSIRYFRHGNDGSSFVINWQKRHMLCELTTADVRAEGMRDLTAFKEFWMNKTKASYFSPSERVYCYAVERLNVKNGKHLEAMAKVIRGMYPR